LGTASEILGLEAGTARGHLNEAENLVAEVIQELTFLIQEMYPQALKEKGLATTLREYVFEWENRNEMEASLVIEGEPRLPLQAEQAVYRIVQEALANVARHSRATRVEVSLSFDGETLRIEVKDDGRGFNPDGRPPGMGLRSIEERVESVGGSVEIVSAPGQGTLVRVKVPASVSRESTSGGGQHEPDQHHHRR
jgi:signal transduction histidine kinase